MAVSFNLSKADSDAQREKARIKQQAARERAFEKQRQKQSDPAYRLRQQEKAQATRERAAQKQRDKLSDPVYLAEQRAKKLDSIARSAAKAKEKPPAAIKSDTKKAPRKPIKSKGLMGRTPTAQERKLMDKIGGLPCVACKAMGRINTLIALHHVSGRVVEFAHAKVLPLCAHHHDVPLTPEERAIHGDVYPVHAKGSYGGKAAFEQAYGTQEHLLAVVYDEIGEVKPWVM